MVHSAPRPAELLRAPLRPHLEEGRRLSLAASRATSNGALMWTVDAREILARGTGDPLQERKQRASKGKLSAV